MIATTFALCGFAVAVIAGLAAGNAAAHVLTTALICMMVCQAAGLAAGAIGERVVGEHLRGYRANHRIAATESAGHSKTSPPDPQNS